MSPALTVMSVLSLMVHQNLLRPAAAFNLKPLGQRFLMDATFAQIADKGTFSTEFPEGGLVPDATRSVLDLISSKAGAYKHKGNSYYGSNNAH